jgi:radical SAM/Cys-rich protein
MDTPMTVSQMDSRILSFEERLRQENTRLRRLSLDTVQINLGKLCNQACLHCHVEAGPDRSEIMGQPMAELALEFIRAVGPTTVDITGGAPELNPSFRFLVAELRRLGLHVIDRSNLTVLFEAGYADLQASDDLSEFLARHQVEITASLPCYTQENVESQRGRGVYQKSMAALGRLNALGYGRDGTGLILNLVYNPGGAFLPGPQGGLEMDYKRELMSRFGLVFNRLFTITNVNLGRFAHALGSSGEAEGYAHLLSSAFNPNTIKDLMCLRQVSLSWDGYLYDCDFNQMLNMRLGNGRVFRLGQMPAAELASQLIGRGIYTGQHCYACTAGTGSSCTGALV